MKGRAFQIRRALPHDSERILACLHAAFAPYKDLYTPAAFADTVLDAITIRTRMREMHVLVATADDHVIGTVSGALCGHGEGHLRGMAVLPEYQSSGVSRDLLVEIEGWLKQNGCKRVTLDTTLPLDRAMNFYAKHGYKRSGRTADFFGMTLIEYAKTI